MWMTVRISLQQGMLDIHDHSLHIKGAYSAPNGMARSMEYWLSWHSHVSGQSKGSRITFLLVHAISIEHSTTSKLRDRMMFMASFTEGNV